LRAPDAGAKICPMRRLLWALLVTAGCTQSPADRAVTVCDTFCGCAEPLPSQAEECSTECLAAIPAVSDACLACVYDFEATCGPLVDQCQAMCFQAAPNPKEGK
jgi:hypothetical protein